MPWCDGGADHATTFLGRGKMEIWTYVEESLNEEAPEELLESEPKNVSKDLLLLTSFCVCGTVNAVG
jgi:hypothetical protein